MQNPKAIRNKLAYFYSGQPHHKFVSFLSGYELKGYADDTDKADERRFKKLRYTIINDKLKSAFVRLIRVVRVSIHSLLFPF